MNTKEFIAFQENIRNIEQSIDSENKLVNKLLFANIITILEVYFQNSLINLLSDDKRLLEKLTKSSKFKNNKITLTKALLNNMNIYLKELLKNIVFHNMPDVQLLYKEVLDIEIEYKKDEVIINAIDKRHDIVHRNGYTKKGSNIDVSNIDIKTTMAKVTEVIFKVDEQIIKKYNGAKQ